MNELRCQPAWNGSRDSHSRFERTGIAVCANMQSLRARIRICLALVALVSSALVIGSAMAQDCRRAGTLTTALEVFDRPPTFSTAQGTTEGNRIAVLGQGSTIYICRQITVGFGVSTTTWSQVSYYTNGSWKFGWALSDNIKVGTGGDPSRVAAAMFSAAYAAAEAPYAQTMAKAPPEDMLPPPPPAVPGLSTPAGKFRVEVQLWIYVLIALVAGILGQTVIDILGASDGLPTREIRRRALTALIYAPIVFLAFLQTTDLDISTNKQLLVIVLLAFQSGFFWQKVFAKSSPPGPEPVARTADPHASGSAH